MHPQQFHGHEFKRQQQFSFICKEQIDVATLELDDEIGIFVFRIAVVAWSDFEGQVEAGIADDLVEERFDARSGLVNRVLSRQAFFLPSLCEVGGVLITMLGVEVLLKNHCCAMPTTLLVSQYNTSPLDADQKK